MREAPQRKGLRLGKYDYSQPGYYFVTVCTAVRGEPVLAEIHSDLPAVGAAALGGPSNDNIPVPKIVLTSAGEIVGQLIENINHVYQGQAGVDCHVVMPDHIHLVVWLRGRENGRRGRRPLRRHCQILSTH